MLQCKRGCRLLFLSNIAFMAAFASILKPDSAHFGYKARRWHKA